MDILTGLIDLIIKGSTLESLVHYLGRQFRAVFVISNPWGKVIATSDAVQFSVGSYLPFSLSPGREEAAFGRWTYLAVALKSGATNYGYLLALGEEGLPQPVATNIDQVSRLLLLALARDQAVIAAEKRHRADFVYDLLYNNFESKEVLVARGQLWGWDLNRPHALMVVELLTGPEDQFQELASTIAREDYPEAILLPRERQLVIIIPALEDKGATGQKLKGIFSTLQEKLARCVPGMLVGGGVGLFYPSTTELYLSFQEAKIALEIGKLRREPGLVFFAELGVEKLLYHLTPHQLEDYYQQTLGRLEAFDRENGTNYLEVLERYFQFNGDFQAIARHFYLHPNTLRYRLQKIGEILAVNIHSLETQLDLLAALKARLLFKRRARG
jgi:sugar diacid utilization regulator